jgi:hypothetical protein
MRGIKLGCFRARMVRKAGLPWKPCPLPEEFGMRGRVFESGDPRVLIREIAGYE